MKIGLQIVDLIDYCEDRANEGLERQEKSQMAGIVSYYCSETIELPPKTIFSSSYVLLK